MDNNCYYTIRWHLCKEFKSIHSIVRAYSPSSNAVFQLIWTAEFQAIRCGGGRAVQSGYRSITLLIGNYWFPSSVDQLVLNSIQSTVCPLSAERNADVKRSPLVTLLRTPPPWFLLPGGGRYWRWRLLVLLFRASHAARWNLAEEGRRWISAWPPPEKCMKLRKRGNNSVRMRQIA